MLKFHASNSFKLPVSRGPCIRVRFVSLLTILFFPDLHKERLQSLIFEGPESARHSENRWIEEELELQIGLLKEKHDQQEEPLFLPDEEIFIYKEESLDIMALATDPPLDLNHPEPSHKHTGLHVPNAVEMHQIEETVLEENIMETVAMCLAVAGMMMLPQLLAAH